jgi:hypothetical protein
MDKSDGLGDDIRIGRIQNSDSVMMGMSYNQVSSILKSIGCVLHLKENDGGTYLRCHYEGLDFIMVILDQTEEEVETIDELGFSLKLTSSFGTKTSNGIVIDLMSSANAWNAMSIDTKSYTIENSLILDTTIPIYGILGQIIVDRIFEWFDANEQFEDFIKASGYKG